jgi:hypothetical protein
MTKILRVRQAERERENVCVCVWNLFFAINFFANENPFLSLILFLKQFRLRFFFKLDLSALSTYTHFFQKKY